jgi:hypothetical protein
VTRAALTPKREKGVVLALQEHFFGPVAAAGVIHALTGAAAGVAVAFGLVSALRALAGLTAGVTIAIGTVGAHRVLAGLTAGAALAVGSVSALRALAGLAAGAAITIGRVTALRALAGLTAGWSQVVIAGIAAVETILQRIYTARRERRLIQAEFERRALTVRREARRIVP